MELELVRLAGGRFQMGSDRGRRDEQPAHVVSIGAFRASRRPVTNAQYRLYVEQTEAAPPPFWDLDRFSGDDLPVVGVSWHDAQAFCEWWSAVGGLPLRLPTEAEREYAARGGIAGAQWPGAGDSWPEAEARRGVAELNGPHIPQTACANGFGLLCMADNVHEWCSDWYARDWYARSPAEAPTGPAEGRRRASRGGSWRHRIKFTRVSARSSLAPGYRYNDYGFRVYADAE